MIFIGDIHDVIIQIENSSWKNFFPFGILQGMVHIWKQIAVRKNRKSMSNKAEKKFMADFTSIFLEEFFDKPYNQVVQSKRFSLLFDVSMMILSLF